MQQPVGKDMATLRIACELNFIDGKKIHINVARHGFHRAHPISRALRLDLLFARHQRNLIGSHSR